MYIITNDLLIETSKIISSRFSIVKFTHSKDTNIHVKVTKVKCVWMLLLVYWWKSVN